MAGSFRGLGHWKHWGNVVLTECLVIGDGRNGGLEIRDAMVLVETGDLRPETRWEWSISSFSSSCLAPCSVLRAPCSAIRVAPSLKRGGFTLSQELKETGTGNHHNWFFVSASTRDLHLVFLAVVPHTRSTTHSTTHKRTPDYAPTFPTLYRYARSTRRRLPAQSGRWG